MNDARGYAVGVIAPAGYVHGEALREVALTVHCALVRLGRDAILADNLAALNIPSEADYIALYAKNTGKPVNTRDWGFYMAYNMFRMAGILQGIMKRYVDGTAASQQALDAGRRARPMAEMGWAQVERMRAA